MPNPATIMMAPMDRKRMASWSAKTENRLAFCWSQLSTFSGLIADQFVASAAAWV